MARDLFSTTGKGRDLFAGVELPPPSPIEAIGTSIKEGMEESVRAAGFMLGIVKPESPEEANTLRRRFFADAAALGVSAVTGGTAGAAMKTIPALARVIISGAVAGGTGGAAYAAVQGDPVLPAAGIGAAVGGALAVPGGFMAQGAQRTAATAARSVAATAEREAAEAAAAEAARPSVPSTFLNEQPGPTLAPSPLPDPRFELPRQGRWRPAPRVNKPKGLVQLDLFTEIQPGEQLELFSPEHFHTNKAKSVALGQRASMVADGLDSSVSPANTPLPRFTKTVVAGGIDMPTLEAAKGAARTAAAKAGAAGADAVQRGEAARTAYKGTLAQTAMEFDKEMAKSAADIFRDFLRRGGAAQARAGRGPSRVRPRRPEPATFAQISEELRLAPVHRLATANTTVHKMLMKLPSGERFAKVYNDLLAINSRVVLTATEALRNLGPVGQEFAEQMSKVTDVAAQRASRSLAALEADLRKLPAATRERLGMALHGAAVPESPMEEQLVERMRAVLDDVASNAHDVRLREFVPSTGQERPFAYRKDYFPMMYSEKAIKKYMSPGPEREAAIAQILRSNIGAGNRSEAEALLERFLITPPEFRYGHLQVARELVLPGFERDPLVVLPAYLPRAWKRIETARTFGASDELAASYISRLRDQGLDADLARNIYSAFADKSPVGMQELARATRSFNIISMLSTAGIVQLAQHANTIGYLGYKNYLRGLGAMFTKEGHEWAAKTGAYMTELVQDLVPYGERSASSHWLSFIGMTPLDKANRIVAALAGRFHAEDMAMKAFNAARAGKVPSKLTRELSRLGLTMDDVMRSGGVLTDDQLSTAGQRASHITQFRGSVLDLPIAKQTPIGQFMYLFKSFAIQQARFVGLMMQEARKGNMAPALRYLSATATLTPAVGSVAMYLRGRPAADDPMWGYLEAMLNGGALGVAGDALRAMDYGPEAVAKFIAGPTGAQMYDFFGTDLKQLKEGDGRYILHDSISHTPLLGRQLADYLVPLD